MDDEARRPTLEELADRALAKGSQAKDGLRCSRCGCRHFVVVYTRRRPKAIVRRRECRHCGRRVTTRERIQGEPE